MNDKTKTCLTDGSPVTPGYDELKDNGQQVDYVTLCPEERAKGFVRPLRNTYQHVGIRPKYPTRELTEEEKERFPNAGYVLFEIYPESESPATGRFWTEREINSGCGSVTKMMPSIAETYARNPKFYGGTFCVGCGKHFPVEQFIWEGTDERVGS